LFWIWKLELEGLWEREALGDARFFNFWCCYWLTVVQTASIYKFLNQSWTTEITRESLQKTSSHWLPLEQTKNQIRKEVKVKQACGLGFLRLDNMTGPLSLGQPNRGWKEGINQRFIRGKKELNSELRDSSWSRIVPCVCCLRK
jgi:hypothetical protein